MWGQCENCILFSPSVAAYITYYRYNRIHYYESSFSSTIGVLFTFSQFPSWHGPQAPVQSSPYFLQLHLSELHPVVQLQWIIFSKISGAGLLSIIVGVSLSPCISQPHFVGSMLSLQPIHTMTWWYVRREWCFVAEVVGGNRSGVTNVFAVATFLQR